MRSCSKKLDEVIVLERKKVLAVLDDLFFTVKINEAAKRAGLDIDFVKSEIDAVEKAKLRPALIILDLNCNSVDQLELIPKLKSAVEFKGISLIGYLSHIQGELKQKAYEIGCDTVLARSAFSQNLPLILKRHAGAL
ncbi:MAG: response regulator [Bryobacteraceae bacterium]